MQIHVKSQIKSTEDDYKSENILDNYIQHLFNSLGLDLWSLCHDQQITLWAEVVCPRPGSAIVGAGVTRSVPVHLSSSMASLSGAVWDTGRAVALSCSGQGSHQLGYLIPKLCSALDRFSGLGWPKPLPCHGLLHFCSPPCEQQFMSWDKWSWDCYRNILLNL